MSTAATASLQYLQLTELSELLRTRTVSPVEVTLAQLARIAALDGKLASYVTVMADQALPDAKRAGVGAVDGRTPGRP
jgi:amidase